MLPQFRGKLRLARFLLGELQGSEILTDRWGFVYEVPDLRESLAFQLAINGSYEPEVRSLLLRHLRPGNVFVDVGANVGVFAIPAAAHVGAKGSVIAIEASPLVFPVLKANASRNKISQIHLVNAVASASAGQTHFYPAPAHRFGMGSRAPIFDTDAVTVPCIALDSLVRRFGLDHVDVIKIDVEGFELDVLKGAIGLLKAERPPLIVFEFIDWGESQLHGASVGAAQSFLLEMGFKIWPLSSYDRGEPLIKPKTSGSEMFVARK